MSDLNTLLDASGVGWSIQSAQAINNNGLIVGIWHHRRQYPCFSVDAGAGAFSPARCSSVDSDCSAPLSAVGGSKQRIVR